MREAVEVLGVQADAREQLARALARRSPRGDAAQPQRRRRGSGRRACAGSARPAGPGRPSASRAAPAPARSRPALVMSAPRKRIAPPVGVDAAARASRISVVLPQPDSPTIAERLALVERRTRRRRPRARGRPCALNERARSAPGSGPRRCSTSSSGASAAVDALTTSPSLDGRARSRRRRPRAARACRSASASSGRGGPGSSGTRASSGGTSVHCSNACGQRGRKWQPCGGVSSDGGEPGDRRQPLRAVAVDARDRAEQPPRVGVLRVVEELVERALLDDAAGVHDDDAVGDVGDDAEVVGDEDDPGAASRRAASRSSSRICAWIVTSSAVVGSSAISRLGRARQRHRDHHALAHAAGELVRVGAQRARARAGCRRAPSARPRGRSPRPCEISGSCARICSTIWSPIR